MTTEPIATEYTEDQRPCVVAKQACGCYVAVCVLSARDLQELAEWDYEAGGNEPSIVSFLRNCAKHSATLEVRPVAFVRGGALNFNCQHSQRPTGV